MLFTGDRLFSDCIPVLRAGQVGNWLAACERILSFGARFIVPGHGPMLTPPPCAGCRDISATWTGRPGSASMQAWRRTQRFDIPLGPYRDWLDAKRIVVDVDTLYREYRGGSSGPDLIRLFDSMARMRRTLRRYRAPGSGACA